MNDVDKKKLQSALMTITTLEGKIEDVMKKGPRAAKFWLDEYAAKRPGQPEALQRKLKAVYAPGIMKLLKDAKVVLKDLDTLYKEAGSAKVLATYPTGKEFRLKVADKRLANLKKFDVSASQFVWAVTTHFGPSDPNYPGMSNEYVRPVIVGLQAVSQYYAAIRTDLAKL